MRRRSAESELGGSLNQRCRGEDTSLRQEKWGHRDSRNTPWHCVPDKKLVELIECLKLGANCKDTLAMLILAEIRSTAVKTPNATETFWLLITWTEREELLQECFESQKQDVEKPLHATQNPRPTFPAWFDELNQSILSIGWEMPLLRFNYF